MRIPVPSVSEITATPSRTEEGSTSALHWDPFEFHVERLRSSEDFKRNEMLFAVVLAVIAALLLYRVGEASHGLSADSNGIALFREVYVRLRGNFGAILPPLAALFYVWHMWIYYSQILFYAEDTVSAQVFTTLTAGVVIFCSAFILPFTKLWALSFAICTFALFAKSVQVRLQAKRMSNHPFLEHSISWVWSTFIGTVILSVLAWNVLSDENPISGSLVAGVIMAMFTLKYVVFYTGFKKQLASAMRNYWGYGTPGAQTIKIETVTN